jgi:hypothetical protein
MLSTSETQVAHIMECARKNKMTVNMVKTEEMIFHLSNPKLSIFPNEMTNIQHVTTFKLLGVCLESDLNFNDHATYIVTVGNQRLYFLSLLRKQRLGIDECASILQAIVLSHVRYALPMYFKYLTSDMVEKK